MLKPIKNPTRFTREWNPRRIALVVLFQAIKDVIGSSGKHYYDRGKINEKNVMLVLKKMKDGDQRNALAWIVDQWSEAPFSFNWVCDTLDISRTEYRRRLINGELVEEAAKIQIALID